MNKFRSSWRMNPRSPPASSRESIGNLSKSMRGSYHVAHESIKDIFDKHDIEDNGFLDPDDLIDAISEITNEKVTHRQIATLIREFDKDCNGKIDVSEFTMMVSYLREYERHGNDFADQMSQAVAMSKRNNDELLSEISTQIYPWRNLLNVQQELKPNMIESCTYDLDFTPAFAPSEMRCLALACHTDMMTSLRDFVVVNKNLLKKFRLTGTSTIMRMLKEVFKDEKKIVYGPSLKSNLFGGDAELVALMCSGKLGGVIFFQDPMSAHAHKSDIACLCRQAIVHNIMIANTPTSAYMMMHTLRSAMENDGKPELIPSFFFSLQCPAVEAYKLVQFADV